MDSHSLPLNKPDRVQNRKLLDRIKVQRCIINDQCIGRSDPSHITSRGAGGGDTPDNVLAMCRRHHTEWHAIGISKFISKYPVFRRWLEASGRWDVLEKANKLDF